MLNPTEAQIAELMRLVWSEKGEEPQKPEDKEYLRALLLACMPHEVRL